MPFRLTAADWRAIFPHAPQDIIDAFASPEGMAALDRAGITETRARLAYALANVEHECGGFTIPKLTENIKYTAERMAQVWPNRFSSSTAVHSKYGQAPGWQLKAFDDIYGNRMGNRPGTHDGSTFIGRGGPQVTGRDGYKEVGERCGLDLVTNPLLATEPKHQPAILAAFWSWKGMNRFADKGDFSGAVRAWNGGTNGMADRQHMMAGNDPVIQRLKTTSAVLTKIDRVEAGKPAAAPTSTASKTAAGGVVVMGGAATAGAAAGGFSWGTIAAVALITICIALLAWHFLKSK